jgi:putative hydrolase of HD superfamily
MEKSGGNAIRPVPDLNPPPDRQPMTLLESLLRLLPLDDLPRTGWILGGVTQPESVAGHILGTCHLALALAPQIDPPLELSRVLAMALVHDVPEAGSGDLPRPAAIHLPEGAKKQMEDALAGEILAPLSGPATEAWAEYSAQETREARFVALCDSLQMGVRWVGYQRAGWRGLGDFEAHFSNLDCEGFPAAEALRQEILGSGTA